MHCDVKTDQQAGRSESLRGRAALTYFNRSTARNDSTAILLKSASKSEQKKTNLAHRKGISTGAEDVC